MSKYTITGIAIPYNSLALIDNTVYEQIKPGAMNALLQANANIKCCIQHNGNYILGSTADRTLILYDSPEGLRYSIALPNTTYANDLAEVMQKNPKTFGASFHMRLQGNDYVMSRQGPRPLRTINNITAIYEITLTAFPAYTATTAVLNSAEPTGDGGERAKGLLQYWKIRERAAAIV